MRAQCKRRRVLSSDSLATDQTERRRADAPQLQRRRHPAAALNDEALGGVDHRPAVRRSGQRRHQSELGASALMALVGVNVKPAPVVKNQQVEGTLDDANRPLPVQFDGDIAQANATGGKARQRVFLRHLQHSLEGLGRQPVERVVAVQHEHAAG